MRIVFPDYPISVKMSNSRRAKYFELGQTLPKKYHTNDFTYKKKPGSSNPAKLLYNLVDKSFVVKNSKVVNEPRYQSLSYNKISTQLKVPVLIKLKEWMKDYMPSTLGMTGPLRVQAIVYDWPVPLNKDLDNMHIWTKAFLDLLKQRGLIIDDSKQHITMAGGFRFIPISHHADRKLVFDIEPETSSLLVNHLMYNLGPKQVTRSNASSHDDKYNVISSIENELGHIECRKNNIYVNFGKTKVIRAHAERIFNQLFVHCVNNNKGCLVDETFYRIHSDRINNLLLRKGVPVAIKVDGNIVKQSVQDGKLQ